MQTVEVRDFCPEGPETQLLGNDLRKSRSNEVLWEDQGGPRVGTKIF